MRWIYSQHRGVRYAFMMSVGNLVPSERLAERPPGETNSIAWLVWHLARTEDLVVNSFINGEPQVITKDDWASQLGNEFRIGTGFSDEEVAGFQVDSGSLLSYWEAVADNTSSWLKQASPEALQAVPDLEAAVKDLPPMTTAIDSGVIGLWGGRTAGYLLGGPVISHGYMHVGEMISIRGRLGIAGFP